MCHGSSNRIGAVPKFVLGIALVLVSVASPVFLLWSIYHGPSRVSIETRGPEQPLLPDPEDFDARPAKGRFLVAGRDLADPRFQETVVLLLSYDARGAMGLVINRPTAALVSEMLPDMSWLKELTDVVYYGGPVEGHRMFLLVHAGARPEDSTHVFDGVYVSASRALLERLVKRPKKAERFRIYAGYAGWAAGQLDREIRRGDWHVLAADTKILFEKDAPDIWPLLIRKGTAIQVWNMRGVVYALSICCWTR